MASGKAVRWHIGVFLAPAVLVYTAIMIIPLFGTLNLSLFGKGEGGPVFVGLANFATLFGDPRWSEAFWNALGNNLWFFVIHMLVQNPIGILLAALLSSPHLRMAAFYRTAIFIPTILSFVIVGFVWKLILSPIWGIAPGMLDAVGLKALFAPWLGKEDYALTTLALALALWLFNVQLQDTLEEGQASRVTNLAQSVAARTDVQRALANPNAEFSPDNPLQRDIDGLRQRLGVDFIVVMNPRALRLTHPEHQIIQVSYQFIHPTLFMALICSFRIDFGTDRHATCNISCFGLCATHSS